MQLSKRKRRMTSLAPLKHFVTFSIRACQTLDIARIASRHSIAMCTRMHRNRSMRIGIAPISRRRDCNSVKSLTEAVRVSIQGREGLTATACSCGKQNLSLDLLIMLPDNTTIPLGWVMSLSTSPFTGDDCTLASIASDAETTCV